MIYVVGHEFPNTDIDSVFSSILLSNFIKQYYKLDSKPICLNNKNNAIYNILKKLKVDYPNKYTVQKEDLFALVDHNNLNQSLDNLNLKNKIFSIVDHHKDECINYLKFKIIKKYGCSATIIYELYDKYNIKITKKQANLFAYAIISDTKNLLLDTCTKKDIQILTELILNYKLKSADNIFKEINDFKSKNEISIKKLLNEDLKIFYIKSYKIYIAGIDQDSSFSRKNDTLKYLKKETSNFDLYCVCFRNLESITSELYYFGILAKYFKNKNYNQLKSRKKFIFPNIEKKIKNVK
jgi:manganese-dependent inorganic pyrophosphatase